MRTEFIASWNDWEGAVCVSLEDYNRAVEEGRRQMREEASEECKRQRKEGSRFSSDDYKNGCTHCGDAIQAIPVKKEPTP